MNRTDDIEMGDPVHFLLVDDLPENLLALEALHQIDELRRLPLHHRVQLVLDLLATEPWREALDHRWAELGEQALGLGLLLAAGGCVGLRLGAFLFGLVRLPTIQLGVDAVGAAWDI